MVLICLAHYSKYKNVNIGRCDVCGKEETLEHVMLRCQKYEAERRNLIQRLREIKLNFDVFIILQRSSGVECYLFFSLSLRNKSD